MMLISPSGLGRVRRCRAIAGTGSVIIFGKQQYFAWLGSFTVRVGGVGWVCGGNSGRGGWGGARHSFGVDLFYRPPIPHFVSWLRAGWDIEREGGNDEVQSITPSQLPIFHQAHAVGSGPRSVFFPLSRDRAVWIQKIPQKKERKKFH